MAENGAELSRAWRGDIRVPTAEKVEDVSIAVVDLANQHAPQ